MVRQVHSSGETLYVITIQTLPWHNHPLLKDLSSQGLKFLVDWGRWFGGYNPDGHTDIWFKDPKQAVWFGLKWGC